VRGRFFWDERGHVLEIIGVTIDVSAQKQSDLQLQAQRDELKEESVATVPAGLARGELFSCP